MDPRTLYDAYSDAMWTTLYDRVLPSWDRLSTKERDAWRYLTEMPSVSELAATEDGERDKVRVGRINQLTENGCELPRPKNHILGSTWHGYKPQPPIRVHAKPFFYLAGPMTGLPKYNFPEFDRIAAQLRSDGLTIASPAELDDPETRDRFESDDSGNGCGVHDDQYLEMLARDVGIIVKPECRGVIAISGWQTSKGARLETYVATALDKRVLLYSENPIGYSLTSIERDNDLADYGYVLHQIQEATK